MKLQLVSNSDVMHHAASMCNKGAPAMVDKSDIYTFEIKARHVEIAAATIRELLNARANTRAHVTGKAGPKAYHVVIYVDGPDCDKVRALNGLVRYHGGSVQYNKKY